MGLILISLSLLLLLLHSQFSLLPLLIPVLLSAFPTAAAATWCQLTQSAANAGVVSGSALLVDYILTITISLAACGDTIFSYLPVAFLPYKLPFVIGLIIFMVSLNLRGAERVGYFSGADFYYFRCYPCAAYRLWIIYPCQ